MKMVSPKFDEAYERFKEQKGIRRDNTFAKVAERFAYWQKREYGLTSKQTKSLGENVRKDGIKPVVERFDIIHTGKGDKMVIRHIDPTTGKFVKSDGSSKRDKN